MARGLLTDNTGYGIMSWRLVHYICPGGKCPVYEFLRDLRQDALKSWLVFEKQRRVQLESNGPMMRSPYWEKLDDGFAEIKWSGAFKSHYRIYASAESDRRLVMYIGVNKRWQKFENSDRTLCEKYRADYKSHEYDEQQRELERCAYYKRREMET